MAATAAAVSALVGSAGTLGSCPTARLRPRFVWRRPPLESVSIRTRNDVGSADLNTKGPLETGLPDPPRPLAAHSGDCLCLLAGSCPSAAQSQYGSPKFGSLSTRCKLS